MSLLRSYCGGELGRENGERHRNIVDTEWKPQDDEDENGFDNRRVLFNKFGTEHVLQLHEYHEAAMHRAKMKDKVVIKIEATSVSMCDVLLRQDMHPLHTPKLPFTTGCDLIGRVVRAGSNASDYKIRAGDRVGTISPFLGSHKKYITIPAYELFLVPDDLDATEMVCMLKTYMVAYQALHRIDEGGIRRGNTVMVTGGNGAVGQAIIRLAKLAGASYVYATAHKNHKKLIESLGGKWLGRDPESWKKAKGKFDIVIDSVCADGGESVRKMIKPGTGKLVCIGASSVLKGAHSLFGGFPYKQRFDMFMISKWRSQCNFLDVFSSMEDEPEDYAQDLEQLFELLRQKRIKPAVAYTIPLDEIAKAHLNIERGGVNGSIVCLPFFDKKGTDLTLAISRGISSAKDALLEPLDTAMQQSSLNIASKGSGITSDSSTSSLSSTSSSGSSASSSSSSSSSSSDSDKTEERDDKQDIIISTISSKNKNSRARKKSDPLAQKKRVEDESQRKAYREKQKSVEVGHAGSKTSTRNKSHTTKSSNGDRRESSSCTRTSSPSKQKNRRTLGRISLSRGKSNGEDDDGDDGGRSKTTSKKKSTTVHSRKK